MEPYAILNRREIYKGSIFDLAQYTVQLPNGKEAIRDIIEHGGAAVIIPVTDKGEIVMVSQYRNGAKKVLLELPAGKLDPGEDPEKCALRELEEETGYRATRIRHLIKMHPVAAYCTEMIHMYLAEGLVPGTANPDADEFVEVSAYPLQDVLDMVINGEILDMKTMLGVLFYSSIKVASK